jgi:hypothetical protein
LNQIEAQKKKIRNKTVFRKEKGKENKKGEKGHGVAFRPEARTSPRPKASLSRNVTCPSSFSR